MNGASDFDVVVVGAGAAGLAAAGELERAGRSVLCVEARDRPGGRVLTVHDPLSPIPIELGAEFVHGRPPELWDIISQASLTACDVAGSAVYFENGTLHDGKNIYERVYQVMDDLQASASKGRDQSFASFLEQSRYSEDVKRWATAYVEGFNAARKEIIGIAGLAEDARAADAIDGDHSFRLLNGYEAVILHLLRGIHVRLSSVVERIEWEPGSAAVHIRSVLGDRREVFRARSVVITVPLGVLQAEPDGNGAIRFDPEPRDALDAARMLQVGQVVRVVLRFDQPFWETKAELSDAGFVFSQEPHFSTWWTPLPLRAPVITGWSAGPHADDLLNQSKPEIMTCALHTLARITGVQPCPLEAAYFHNWHDDPFSRGAYSYAPAGGTAARRTLADPVANTLFFAGEAADLGSHSGTVHGAIASGKRAARLILSRA